VPTLLVADNDPKLANSLGGLLRGRGYRALIATSGEQALELVTQEPVDLLLTEIPLSGMTGFELVGAARRHDPTLPFVVLSSTENFWWAVEAMRLGAKDFLVKHHDRIDVLVGRIEFVLAQVRAERETQELFVQVSTLHEEFLRNLVYLERENAELQERLKGGRAVLGEYRILVVDDEPHVCGLLRDLFGSEGYTVETAGSAEQAAALVGPDRFHLVIVDKNLPGESGLDLLRRVKEQDPQSDVLIITAYATLDSAIAALEGGAVGYLLKPFENLDEVLEKVRDLRRRHFIRTRSAHFLERFKGRNRDFIEKYKDVKRRLSDLSARGSA
jgi:DNA-binding response OmpR family regulator